MGEIIHVDHVSMNFRMNASNTTSLKEWLIKLVKHQLRYTDMYALNDVSFGIERGEIVGIIGSNGAGKSTLLKVISGIYTPTSGRAVIGGRIAPMLELGSGFDYELSGTENVYLNGAILGYDEDFLKGKYDEIVEFSELGDFMAQPLKIYSSGMMMRLAFSIATLVDPEILIVDEILAVGDERFQKKSLERMMNLMRSGKTVLMVSHNLEQIRNMCTRAIWMEKGKVRMDGPSDVVCTAYHESQLG